MTLRELIAQRKQPCGGIDCRPPSGQVGEFPLPVIVPLGGACKYNDICAQGLCTNGICVDPDKLVADSVACAQKSPQGYVWNPVTNTCDYVGLGTTPGTKTPEPKTPGPGPGGTTTCPDGSIKLPGKNCPEPVKQEDEGVSPWWFIGGAALLGVVGGVIYASRSRRRLAAIR